MLTKRQKQVLDYIQKCLDKNTVAPSLEEIKKHLRLRSVSTAHYHVETLRSMGFLQKEVNHPRTLDLIKEQKLIQIPILGTIAAGSPIEAIENKESIAIPQSKIKATPDHFGLRVSGDSMIEENIHDGDVVIVRSQNTAENGEKIVALINGTEVTLKKFYRDNGKVRLEPANQKLSPIIISAKKLKVQGVVVDVIKNQAPTRNVDIKSNESESVEIKKETGRLRNLLNDLSAKEWIPETISVYVQKGLGAGHQDAQIERQHPAPFSFQDVARLIRFFTKENQKVLDPFCGVASTLKACALNNREGHGIEIVEKYYKLGLKRLETEVDANLFSNKKQHIYHADAFERIKEFSDDYFDFIVTSPPYWNILSKVDHKAKQERLKHNLDTKYSTDPRDIGNIEKYEDFLLKLSSFFIQCSRILKPNKYLCIIVSDFRNKSRYHMFHSELAAELEKNSYTLKGITILYQKFKKVFPYGYPFSYVPNIHHQYILILQNNAKRK